jgi:hypothetical protein
VASLSIDELDDEAVASREDQRDVLGELEITARLMITGGEAKEEARLSRADRSLIRECILDAAQTCVAAGRQVLTRDVRDALLRVAADPHLPEKRRERAQEMGESIDLFCQGFEGELFDREGTPWPESDVTIVDLATYAREGYEAQMSISYISLMNTVNNLAERDQYLGDRSSWSPTRAISSPKTRCWRPSWSRGRRCGASSALGSGWRRKTLPTFPLLRRPCST